MKMKLTCRTKLQENTLFMLELFFGYFYQECLLAEDRFKKEDLVKNAFFRQSVKLKFFFVFLPMKAPFGLLRLLCPFSSALSYKVQIILALRESAILLFYLWFKFFHLIFLFNLICIVIFVCRKQFLSYFITLSLFSSFPCLD